MTAQTASNPLLAAIQAGDLPTVERLLAEEPGQAARHASGASPVLEACYRFQDEAVQLLLAAEPTLDLFETAAAGDEARAAALLEADAGAASAISDDGFTALHLASFFGHLEIVRRLLAVGADPNALAKNPSRLRPLHSATARRSEPITRALLDAGADPNQAQAGGWTALHAAAKHGDEALVGLLLARGADRELKADDGQTAADMARGAGEEAMVRLLEG